jgi:folate-dependent phosphoribosylglycinamide formyltransferase PurN
VEYRVWDGKSKVSHKDDFIIIAGAGIIDPSLFGSVPILNVHPGIIPLVRGLDAYKWAIYNGHPLGISLHIISKEVDKGNLLTIKKTPIFESDTYYSLARRHYEYEINLLKNSLDYVGNFIESPYPETSSNMRMTIDKEDSMMLRFEKWKLNYCLKNSFVS